jgi:hypothetical protein
MVQCNIAQRGLARVAVSSCLTAMAMPPECVQVEGLDPFRARALFEEGLRTPAQVLRAEEQRIKKALSSVLPRSMRRRMGLHAKGGTAEAAQVLLTPHNGPYILPYISHVLGHVTCPRT